MKVSDAGVREDRLGEVPKPGFAPGGPIRVVTGPQDQHFSGDAVEQLLTDQFTVTDGYDRMGM